MWLLFYFNCIIQDWDIILRSLLQYKSLKSISVSAHLAVLFHKWDIRQHFLHWVMAERWCHYYFNEISHYAHQVDFLSPKLVERIQKQRYKYNAIINNAKFKNIEKNKKEKKN